MSPVAAADLTAAVLANSRWVSPNRVPAIRIARSRVWRVPDPLSLITRSVPASSLGTTGSRRSTHGWLGPTTTTSSSRATTRDDTVRGTMGASTNPRSTSPLITCSSTRSELATARLTRTSGWDRRSRDSHAGARYSATVMLAATCRFVLCCAARLFAPMATRSRASSASRAHSSTTRPSGVNVEPLGVRYTNWTDNCRSRRASARLTFGWAMPSARPAPLNDPASARATSNSSERTSGRGDTEAQ